LILKFAKNSTFEVATLTVKVEPDPVSFQVIL